MVAEKHWPYIQRPRGECTISGILATLRILPFQVRQIKTTGHSGLKQLSRDLNACEIIPQAFFYLPTQCNPSHPQILCKEVGLESLFKRHQNGKKHGQIVRCSFGQRAKGYLAFQDQMPERSFSLVVGKRDAQDILWL